MAKAGYTLPNGKVILLGLEGPDIPGISSNQVISDELDPDRLPNQGIEYEKLSPALIRYLLEMAERELALAEQLSGGGELQEVRASEYHGSSNVEVR
jgi:hypothetical protein